MGNEEEKTIFGVFNPSDIQKMSEDYKRNLNAKAALRKICEPIFRKNKVRCIAELRSNPSIETRELEERIKTACYAIQANVITREQTKTKKVHHKKGDFKCDEHGQPIMTPDKKGYETYQANEIEEVLTKTDVPFWDYANSPQQLSMVEKYIDDLEVLPDFGLLTAKTCTAINYERGCEIIRELTNSYQFEDAEKFVERFALLVCNAKAKALNHQPTNPVLFSLVGGMHMGKSWLATMIKRTYDEVFESKSGKTSFRRLLGGSFNGAMLTRGFLTFDEKNGVDSKQCEELKTLITEPEVEVNAKYRDPITVNNLVTFLSTTNESIKDVMGLQQDRRLVEFVLSGRPTQIAESKLHDMLVELWMVMPIDHPNSDKVIDELLGESKVVLDSRMDEIVCDLFAQYKEQIVRGRYVNRHGLREAIKEYGGTRADAVINWCIGEGIMTQNTSNGQLTLKQKKLDELVERQGLAERQGEAKAETDTDIESILFGKNAEVA